jgi:hypothetical protein
VSGDRLGHGSLSSHRKDTIGNTTLLCPPDRNSFRAHSVLLARGLPELQHVNRHEGRIQMFFNAAAKLLCPHASASLARAVLLAQGCNQSFYLTRVQLSLNSSRRRASFHKARSATAWRRTAPAWHRCHA